MTSHNQMKNNCLEFECLISAAIDGELDAAEFALLESHVDQCEDCRHQYSRFEIINDWLVAEDLSHASLNPGALDRLLPGDSGAIARKAIVETSSRVPAMASAITGPVDCLSTAANSKTLVDPKFRSGTADRPAVTGWRRNSLFAGGALAAAGLAAFLMSGNSEPRTTNTEVVDLATPVKRISDLNFQSQLTQASQARSMELELRTMRLQNRTSNADASEIEAFDEQIEAMINRLRVLESETL